CPFMQFCAARLRGDVESFPRKLEKTEGQLRRGAAFWVTRADGAVLVRTRPPKGLLGGMTEIPTTAWTHDFDEAQTLLHAPQFSLRGKVEWRRLPDLVKHVFTHFPLELIVFAAKLKSNPVAPRGMRFVPRAELDGEALPNVMRKVVALASGEGKMQS